MMIDNVNMKLSKKNLSWACIIQKKLSVCWLCVCESVCFRRWGMSCLYRKSGGSKKCQCSRNGNGWRNFSTLCSAGWTMQSTGLHSKGLFSELFWTDLLCYALYSILGSPEGGESERREERMSSGKLAEWVHTINYII